MRSVPTRMRAMVVLGGESRLTAMDIDAPRPQSGEALLRVLACGVCHTDLHVLRNEVAFPRPAVLGHEVSGEIVAFGAGTVTDLGIGDTVVSAFILPCTDCPACRCGRDDMCERFFAQNRLRGTLYDGTSRLQMPNGDFLAMYSMGGLAEYCVVPVSALTPLPTGLDARSSAILGCAGLTAYGAVHRAGDVAPNSSVAVIGVGGVGSALIQMSRSAGADTVIAVDIAEAKLERARKLGATDTVDASQRDPVETVRTLTGGGADVVFEALGLPTTFQQATDMVGDGGRMVAVGIAAADARAAVEITPLVRRGRMIIGSYGGRTRVDLPKVVELARTGAFTAADVISTTFSLEDADQAYRTLAAGEIAGRAILVPS